jgi:hypothetical protein
LTLGRVITTLKERSEGKNVNARIPYRWVHWIFTESTFIFDCIFSQLSRTIAVILSWQEYFKSRLEAGAKPL